MSREAFTAYAVWDDDEGLHYETIADTPRGAVGAMGDDSDHTRTLHRMIAGKIKVVRVRIEPLTSSSGQLVPPQE